MNPASANMFIETVSGQFIDPMNPDADNIDIHDIAWALSRMPRFGGHALARTSFNVAQHSIYVCDLVALLLAGKIAVHSTLPHDQLGAAEVAVAAQETNHSNDILLRALLHDAHEAYTGDIITPVKHIPQLYTIIKQIETGLDECILKRVGLCTTSPEHKIIIKYCDRLAAAVESWHCMPSRGLDGNLPHPPLGLLDNFPQPQPAASSYAAFIERFEQLHK